ncbi:hypothetical protein LNTAR_15372 [Lentisphaera araneosa HTCC2155]|uniref:Uncharacterized protein n=1 Tax=Lentisphaera araneosa HTCC2155 TaxID=313628 RepID=A6DU59_9BACT|nr:hypothetical protein [Lentisphaera araneosa]EDM24818.1 hypothetical protein LNTAR_15372 [Lentisphaera araneosa HTCC2155]
MNKIFSFRASMTVTEFPEIAECSWPLGSFTFYKNHLLINAGMKKYELLYTEIDHVETEFLHFKIIHNNKKVPKSIWSYTPFLGTRIKKKILEFKLPIEIKKIEHKSFRISK